MKAALLSVWKAALKVFQRTGHLRLAMSLQDREVHEKSRVKRELAHFKRSNRRVNLAGLVVLQVGERDVVASAHFIIPGGLHRPHCLSPYPAALDYAYVADFVIPEVLYAPCEDSGMSRCAFVGSACYYEVGLEGDICP